MQGLVFHVQLTVIEVSLNVELLSAKAIRVTIVTLMAFLHHTAAIFFPGALS